MKKTFIITTASLFVVIVVYVFYFTTLPHSSPAVQPISSPKNATYKIEGQNVTLGSVGSTSKITTQYFGDEVVHDFDGDGRNDTAFILTQNTGGSGTFFYLVVALNTVNGYVGSEGFFLGDRIAPQTVEMGKGNIILVNYADRKLSDSFAVPPSVGKSVWLLLDPKTMQFGEVAQNFEGEANPSKMTLGMKKWNWISTTYNNGSSTTPRLQNKFTITFKSPNTFSATTDCNGVGGEYSVAGNLIKFERMMSTEMFCEGSQESEFSKALGEVQSYHFTSKGELVFDLKFDSGVMVFK
ncbi:MAG: META domain-containing protein [Candidatus Paceibacterota bacterium]|jgi:heat shock protein HslJ